MPINERRLHFRVDDHLYFDYKVLAPGENYSDLTLTNQLLGENSQKYLDATQYFQNIDYELTNLTQAIALKEPAVAHYLNLLNAKIDYLSRHTLMAGNLQLRKVNIGLGGMSFKSTEQLKENSLVKIILYTKPKMVPIIIDSEVIYCKFQADKNYRTSVQFNDLTQEQEQLLSQHILQVQAKGRGD